MSRDTLSGDSLAKASESKVDFSGHGDSLGAAGEKEDLPDIQGALDRSGETEIISPPEGGFQRLKVGLQWNNIVVEESSGFMGLIKKAMKKGVDLDLGCFFEMQDGTRGVLQPFGELFGRYDSLPYIHHSGDERTGDKAGDDEHIEINGAEWSKIKRVLIYTYIYQGPNNWNAIKPEVNVTIDQSQDPLTIRPSLKKNDLTVCALATLKNVKNGIQIVTHGEYFNSQASMDRAFGFGLQWEDGAKN